jgi:hypothetical protein
LEFEGDLGPHAGALGANPKSEGRKKAEVRKPNCMQRKKVALFGLRFSDFFRVSGDSAFGFCRLPKAFKANQPPPESLPSAFGPDEGVARVREPIYDCVEIVFEPAGHIHPFNLERKRRLPKEFLEI